MASNSSILCGPCEYRHVTKKAEFWCSVCEEGLCNDCHGHHSAIKSTRDHEIMSIKSYKSLTKGMLSVNAECDLHNEKFELYCPSHEIHCCVNCVNTKHTHCTGVTLLKKVVQNIKSSTSLSSTVSILKERLQNIDGFIENRTDNSKEVDTDKENIKKEFKNVRVDIESKLDILETTILKEVDLIHQKHKTDIDNTVKKLQQKREALNKTLIDFENLQKNASDFHIYMVMKKLETDLLEEGKEINLLLSEEGMKSKRFSFSLNTDLSSIISETAFLGKIAVRTKPNPVHDRNIDFPSSAQFSTTVSTTNVTSVKIKRRLVGFNFPAEDVINISSIIVLPDQKILLADYGDAGGILLFSDSGHFITKIVEFGKPYGTALVGDSRMAVSFPKKENIKILRLGSRISLIRTLQLDVDLNAISYYDTYLLVCSRPRNVLIVDLHGAIVKKLDLDLPYGSITFIYCQSHGILISEYDSDIVHCFDFNGKELWKATFGKGKDTRNLCADKYGNVLCVGMNTNTLVCLSKDGQKMQDLAWAQSHLVKPKAIFYDKSSESLLIAGREMQFAAVFELVY
ncbi:unnamed protein product [Mytilus coruscus]|uniref:B box-type domain-containing protein n=1 Tax=Mytilus coruscus TaxID=42192 RepID=A0A6J8CMN6_MYTCO|nr:unnamed protein product [Mytilus coruscus]